MGKKIWEHNKQNVEINTLLRLLAHPGAAVVRGPGVCQQLRQPPEHPHEPGVRQGPLGPQHLHLQPQDLQGHQCSFKAGRPLDRHEPDGDVQGGSDKSGILQVLI